MQIGVLARRSGVPIQTIRYYEDRGLLHPSTRKSSGYRLYDESAVAHLRFIRRAQALGFTLTEVGELLALREASPRRAASVQAHAAAKIAQVDAKLRDLTRVRAALISLSTACRHHPTEGTACALLAALADETPSADPVASPPPDRPAAIPSPPAGRLRDRRASSPSRPR